MRWYIGGMIKLHGVVQLKSIGGFDSCLEDPFLNTILNRKGRFSIGKSDVMPPLLQPFTEVHGRISRACPLPVAEKMKNLHSIENLFKDILNPPHPSRSAETSPSRPTHSISTGSVE